MRDECERGIQSHKSARILRNSAEDRGSGEVACARPEPDGHKLLPHSLCLRLSCARFALTYGFGFPARIHLAFIMTVRWSQTLACEYPEASPRECSLKFPAKLAGRYREWNRTQYCFAI